jgi:hypothetical protein
LTQGGPLLNAIIGVSKPRSDALVKAGQPVPSAIAIRALVDTGASGSCVDPWVLKKLELTPTGSVDVLTPSTGPVAHKAEQYDISLSVPPAVAGHVSLFLPVLPVICSDLAVQGIAALIGRDILQSCVLVYNGSHSTFTLAF